MAAASAAQSSANQAQTTANQAGVVALAAGEGTMVNAEDIAMVNQRVSDVGSYTTVVEAALFFEPDQSTLSDADKKSWTNLPATRRRRKIT